MKPFLLMSVFMSQYTCMTISTSSNYQKILQYEQEKESSLPLEFATCLCDFLAMDLPPLMVSLCCSSMPPPFSPFPLMPVLKSYSLCKKKKISSDMLDLTFLPIV